MLRCRLVPKCSRYFLLVVSILTLLGSVGTPNASTYYSLTMDHHATVGSPEVVLQNGTAGTSTIYTNNTSAKVSVEAPLFDYVDSNDPDVDSSVDKGMHSDFTAQQTSPDSIYDNLTEENMEAILDYVDNNTSDVDSSSDVGTHSDFENQKAKDSSYDILAEQNTGIGEIAKVGTDTSGTGTASPLTFSHTLVAGSNRLVVVSVGIENNGNVGTVSATYGGQSMTLAVEGRTATTGYVYYCGIFYILEANLPSEGSQQVFISVTGIPSTMEINGLCSEYTGVTQGAPEATDNTDEPSPADDTIENTIIPSTGAWVISAVGCGNVGSFTHGQGQIEILDFADGSSTFAVAELRGASGETSLDSTYATGANRMDRVASSWIGVAAENNYELDIEIQFTAVIDYLPIETLCIGTGAFSGAENIGVDFWNGTGWENLATDLTAYSCNIYAISLTSTTFTIRFRGGDETGDTTQDQWQIDVSLLRLEGAGGKEDAVDNDASNVDSSADLGELINFDNMKAADSAYANLTELAPGSITYVNAAEASATSGTSAQVNKPTGTVEDDFMITLLVSTIGNDVDGSTMFSAPTGWTLEHQYIQTTTSGQHAYVYWKVAGASEPSSYTWTWASLCGWVAQIATFRGVDTASPIHAEGTVNQETSSSPMSPSVTTTLNNAMIWLYDMTDGTVVPASGGAPVSTLWIDQTEVDTPGNGVGISTAYYVQASAGATGNRDWTLDASDENSGQQYALKPAPTDCQLDQEVQWTDAVHSLPNEELCIYVGATGVEDINVDTWNGTAWEAVFTDLLSGWNNASITNWLTTSTFTIRFKGGNETGDSSQDTWQIDIALIHVWHDGGESFELNLEVQWTNTDYTRTNEKLCIKTGTFTGSENIQVRVWNSTGSSWHWIMNLMANQWNNVSIVPYLTSSIFTIQFLGATETGDTTQDSWNIDATLLHVWAGAWLGGWEKRVKIAIDHNYVDSALSNFPVLVYLSNSSSGLNNDDVSFVFDEVGLNRKKIAITESDGTTQCYVEIEKWDDVSEQAWLWVKVPSIINASDTDLYLYYDNDHVDNTDYVDDTNTGNSVNVWDSYFKMVQHMRDNTTSSIVDSTSNDNDGTKKGAGQPAVTTSGEIDGAQNFPSGDVAGGDYIDCGNDPSLQIAGYLTIGAWVKIAGSDGEYLGIAGKLDSTDQEGYSLVRHSDNTFRFWVGGGTMASADSDTSYTDSDWHYVVGVVNNGNNYIYVDGVKQQDEDTTTLIDSGYWAHIGRQYYDYDQRYWEGIIDEVRISNVSRSTAWISASYESGRDHLLDFGSEENSGASGGTYDYVLRVNNTVTDSWQIRLKERSASNVDRLANCTVYFHNSTDGTSRQIYIQNGAYINQTGPWYDLVGSQTIYVAMTAEANSNGTSLIYVYLEICIPGTSTYLQYTLAFEIT